MNHRASTHAGILVMGTLLALIGCKESFSELEEPQCPEIRQSVGLAEARECALSCEADADCPAGTVCRECPAEDEACVELVPGADCEIPDGEMKFCRLPERGTVALVEGFEVSEFRLDDAMVGDMLVEGVALYQFFGPSNARFVTCGLFACPPVVQEDPEGRLHIANFDECTLATTTFQSPTGFFDLTRPDYVYPLDAEGRVCEDRPLATDLLAGCWAYGRGSVIGATILIQVEAEDEIFNYYNGVVGGGDFTRCELTTCRSDLADGETMDPTSIGATCEGQCLPRCVTQQDCDGSNEVVCRHDWNCSLCDTASVCDFSYLGVCSEPINCDGTEGADVIE